MLGAPEDEFVSQDSNVKGTLSMANTGQPDSGGSQFFINAPCPETYLCWAQQGRSACQVRKTKIKATLPFCFALEVRDNTFLDWFSPGDSRHPVFGRVVDGYDVAVKISKVYTQSDRPVEPVMMESVSIKM